MTQLRSEALHIASKLPKGNETRRKILASLKEARGGEWKNTIQGDKMRARWDDYGTLLIEEMPGKPVKRKVRRNQFSTQWALRSQRFNPSGPVLILNIVEDANLRPSMSYDQAVAAMHHALDMAADKLRSEAVRLQEKYPDGSYQTPDVVDTILKKMNWPQGVGSEDTVSFLEVEPKDYKSVTFGGRDFGGTAEWDTFTFSSEDMKDEWMAQMEGMRATYSSTSKGAARKLFKLLKANPDAVKRMDVDQFKKFLDQSKVGYRYNPTVWR